MSLQQLQEKWAPVLNHEALPEIEDSHKRGVVAQLLENQEKAITEETSVLNETLQTTGYTGAYRYWSCCWFRPCSDLPDQTLHASTDRLRYRRRSTDDWSYWTDLRNAYELRF